MQQAIYAISQLALFSARFEVDIAGALFDGVLQQPVDDVHDVGVVGAGLGVALAELQQMLQFTQASGLLALCALTEWARRTKVWANWRTCTGLASTRRIGLPRLRTKSASHSHW